MKNIIFVLFSFSLAFQASAKVSQKKHSVSEDCRLAEGGLVNNEAKAIVIQRDGAVLAGANRLEDALGLMETLKKQGQCSPAHQECNLAGEGVVAGSWEPHRILLDGQAVTGGRDLGTVMAKLAALRDSGTCTW